MRTYYFDVLPLHPKPEHLESLTSYLMRLAELNGISSVDALSALCFPRQDRRITREIADYPPISFSDLVRVGTWSEDILRTTTFFHLAAKFGRSTLPQPMSRFLSGCVGLYLRYCPACFAEQPVKYYLLPWRFLLVTCCRKHKCRLLEVCGHCGEVIPLFKSPFTVGNCPRCRQCLKLCVAASESDQAVLELSLHIHDDIVFFLTPQLWEENSKSIVKRIGQLFAATRRLKRRTAVEAADQTGITQTVIEGIERGEFQSKGATLQGYFKYAQYLCLDLKEAFGNVIEVPDRAPTPSMPLCPACQQRDGVTRYGYNRSGSQRYLCRHCRSSFTASPTVRNGKRHSS